MEDPMLLLSILLAVVLGGLLLRWGLDWSSVRRTAASKSGARLPKGSFGWPIIGETLSFARNPANFASSHVKRYGKIFKSSLFRQPTILGTTPQFAKFVTSNNNDLFESGWPANLTEVVGPKGLMFQTGARHMSIKKIFQKQLLPESLRNQVNVLETIILENMASWEQGGTINGKKGTEKITMETAIWLLLGLRGIGSTPEGKGVLANLESLNKSIGSVPVNLPGTAFNKGLKAKAALTKYFKSLLEKRKGEENSQVDMLGVLLAAQEDPQAREEVKDLDDDMIVDNLLQYWFAAYDTSSTTLTWILKLLVDNPEVFRRVQAEQQEILKNKDLSVGGPRLSWEDCRIMTYTQKFYMEVQRIISIVPVVIRKTTQDIEYEGNLIPRGWAVCSMNNVIHSDSDFYPNPQSFDPDRFDVTPKPYTFLPFSTGAHMCPGVEMAKLISFIFIHHLTTTYTYGSAAPDQGIEYNSFLIPRGGYPINISRRV